jgi:hypothetical protein
MIPILSALAEILVLAALALDPTLEVRDVNGRSFRPFRVDGKAQVLFFLSADCPISRFYAPEIQRICKDYAGRGVGCGLVYEDRPADPALVRNHLMEFGYRDILAITDDTGNIAKQTGASVTPQAVVIDKAGKIRYRGRVDNFYADLGKLRRQVTVHDVRDALDAVVAGRTVAHPETRPFGCFIVSAELPEEKNQ